MTLSASTKEAIAGYTFVLPILSGFLVFLAFPVVASFFISLSEWNMINEPVFAGIANYLGLFQDPFFWTCLQNTAYFSLFSVLFGIFLSLYLANLFHETRPKGAGFFKSSIFIPVILSSVAVALVWQWILDSQTGIFNHLLGFFGLPAVPWLTSPAMAMNSVVMVAVWRQIGYNMVIFLAALANVPDELYEASSLDGSSRFQTFWNVTWPLISPSTFFIAVTSVINSFQVFDLTTILTNGGPANATNTLIMMIYQNGFQFFKMGYASAIAYALFAIILVITAVQTIVSKKWVHS
jgi:multiple sugar transport system permease protein